MGKSGLAVACLLAVSACSSAVPSDVNEGVGFGSYDVYQERRATQQAMLRGEPAPGSLRAPQTVLPPQPQPVAVAAAAPAPTTPPRAPAPVAAPVAARVSTPTDNLAARAAAAIDAAEAAPRVQTTAAPGNRAISDEQDFQAVAARESIESDAERLRRMQEQLVVVEPTAVPDRTGQAGPNVIDYALATSHPVGQQVYSRSPFRQGRSERNCRAYRSDDLAQEAFLQLGGPQRDRQALDPDGDGYACGWDPAAYRAAARAARGN